MAVRISSARQCASCTLQRSERYLTTGLYEHGHTWQAQALACLLWMAFYTRAYWLVAVPRPSMFRDRRAACVSCHCHGNRAVGSAQARQTCGKGHPCTAHLGPPHVIMRSSLKPYSTPPRVTRGMLLHWDAAGHDASGADVPARTPQTRTSGTSRRCSTWRRPCGSRATWCPRWRAPGPWLSTAAPHLVDV